MVVDEFRSGPVEWPGGLFVNVAVGGGLDLRWA